MKRQLYGNSIIVLAMALAGCAVYGASPVSSDLRLLGNDSLDYRAPLGPARVQAEPIADSRNGRYAGRSG